MKHYVTQNTGIYKKRSRRTYRRGTCIHGGEVNVLPTELPENVHRKGVQDDRHPYGRFLNKTTTGGHNIRLYICR